MTENAEHEVTAGTAEAAPDPFVDGPPDFARFTVDVEPYKKGRYKGLYDIFVKDVNGNLLLSSRQGYENRQEAVDLAYRLLASAEVWGRQLGIDPPELRKPEPARLNVHGMDGSVESFDLR